MRGIAQPRTLFPWLWLRRWQCCLLALLFSASLQATIVGDVRLALAENHLSDAEAALQRYHAANGITSEYLEALSWLGRAALSAKQYDKALANAGEIRNQVIVLLKKRPLDADKNLPIALGASIEVTAQTLTAQGQRDQAVDLLRKELAAYKNTSIRARLQKNLNLLTLEGKPAPALEAKEHLGPAVPSLSQLKGKPVILFFWAHWCPDCKQEAPLLARLQQEMASKGLTIIGPTQRYGYIANGTDAKPAEELRYIEEVRRQFYGMLSAMPVPVSEETFKNYGASTTPTFVFIDAKGTVRLYHPGAMTYPELLAAASNLLKIL